MFKHQFQSNHCIQNIHEHKSIKPQPAIRTLSSPAHLLFQLIKLTTLPYLISQLISSSSSSKPIPISTSSTETSNQNEKSYSKTSISSSEPTTQERGHQSIQWPSLLPSSASKSYHSKFNTKRTYSTFPGYTPLQLTSKIHDRIRSTEKDDQDLKELRSSLVQLDKPKPITLHLALLKLRPFLLSSRLTKSSKPDLIQLSQVWKSNAVSEMVDSWKSSKDRFDRKPNERNDYEIRSLMNVRKNLFLKNGPRLCDCLKVKRRKLGSSRDDELFEYFKSHLHQFDRISRLRFIDICLARRRWDLATEIMFEEKSRKEIHEEPKLKNRSLRQVTGLLLHLRSTTDDLEKSKELLNSVEIICEKLKDGKEMNGLRLNRLSLDVICRFASIQISRTNRKGKAYKVRKQCREFLRSLIHFDHLHRSEPWLKIRLLDHFSQFKATQLQFDELYHHSFKNTSHPSNLSPRMARIILKASSNFKQVKNLNEDLIKRSVIEISNQRDQRPLIDYLLGSDQLSTDPEILNQTFKVCEQVSKDYDHLLYRLSKLSSFDLIDLRNFSIPIKSNDPNLFAKTLILIKLYKKSKRNRKMNEEDLPKRFENGLIKLIRQTIQRLWKMKRKENELRKVWKEIRDETGLLKRLGWGFQDFGLGLIDDQEKWKGFEKLDDDDDDDDQKKKIKMDRSIKVKEIQTFWAYQVANESVK